LRISIDDYTPDDIGAFEALNLEWIQAHFEVEPTDLETLRDPQGKVLDTGGRILMARLDGEAVGTVALIPMGGDRFELAKMAVAPRARGLGIGERLGRAALETARRLGAERVFLESNRALTPAISLYRKLGFREVEGVKPSPYTRCDIQMEVVL